MGSAANFQDEAMNFWDKLETIDRRWVYLMVAIAVVFPFIFPLTLPISVTPEAQSLFDHVEALPDSSTVFLVFDYYPSTIPECQPIAVGALHVEYPCPAAAVQRLDDHFTALLFHERL